MSEADFHKSITFLSKRDQGRVMEQYRAALSASAPAAPDSDSEEDAYLIQRLGHLLAGVAIALKGPEKARHLHGYQDLPEIAQKMKLELDLYRHTYGEMIGAPAAGGDHHD